ncbi:hypothetical protein GGX14DRAFT_654829 [Mycena pura]|uniref:Uncharacterized protein n=1 Tax=Mycena pura TaxID=153505 RepID=A0AAD6V3R5_9AGAR|nr:hypothetical protein GGX14DRAFT_654829 [Mycena pura]
MGVIIIISFLERQHRHVSTSPHHWDLAACSVTVVSSARGHCSGGSLRVGVRAINIRSDKQGRRLAPQPLGKQHRAQARSGKHAQLDTHTVHVFIKGCTTLEESGGLAVPLPLGVVEAGSHGQKWGPIGLGPVTQLGTVSDAVVNQSAQKADMFENSHALVSVFSVVRHRRHMRFRGVRHVCCAQVIVMSASLKYSSIILHLYGEAVMTGRAGKHEMQKPPNPRYETRHQVARSPKDVRTPPASKTSWFDRDGNLKDKNRCIYCVRSLSLSEPEPKNEDQFRKMYGDKRIHQATKQLTSHQGASKPKVQTWSRVLRVLSVSNKRKKRVLLDVETISFARAATSAAPELVAGRCCPSVWRCATGSRKAAGRGAPIATDIHKNLIRARLAEISMLYDVEMSRDGQLRRECLFQPYSTEDVAGNAEYEGIRIRPTTLIGLRFGAGSRAGGSVDELSAACPDRPPRPASVFYENSGTGRYRSMLQRLGGAISKTVVFY